MPLTPADPFVALRIGIVMREMADLSGSKLQVAGLAKALQEAGHHPIVVCMEPLHKDLDIEQVALAGAVDGRIARFTQLAACLETLHLQRPFDLVHASYPHAVLAAHTFKLAYQVPYVISLHGGEVLKATTAHWKHAYLRCALLEAERVITLAEHLPSELTDVLGISMPPVDYIPAGLDDGIVDGAWSDFSPGIDPVDLSPSDIVVMFVGRMLPLKGPHVLLAALEVLCLSYPNLKGVFVGDGPQLDELKRTTESIGLSDRVLWLGYRSPETIPALISRADLLVAPSTLTEGRGNSVMLEAMAVGTPVIATTVPSVPQLIQHGFNGLLAEPEDVLGIVTHIETLLNNKELAAQISENARRTAEESKWSNRIIEITKSYRLAMVAIN